MKYYSQVVCRDFFCTWVGFAAPPTAPQLTAFDLSVKIAYIRLQGVPVPITIVGGTAGDQARVKDAADEVIIRLWQVTVGWLRTCIKTKATRGKVIIENCEKRNLLGYNNWKMIFGYKWRAEDEIHICINNIGADDDLLANVMLHEWAHACCWNHGDGQGVPGNNGKL